VREQESKKESKQASKQARQNLRGKAQSRGTAVDYKAKAHQTKLYSQWELH